MNLGYSLDPTFVAQLARKPLAAFLDSFLVKEWGGVFFGEMSGRNGLCFIVCPAYWTVRIFISLVVVSYDYIVVV